MQLHKVRRKSTDSSTSTPPPPLTQHGPAPSVGVSDNDNSAAFGQQLLLALSKAHAVATFDKN